MQKPGVASLDERGETLVELVVALAILSIAGVAIMTGLLVSVKSSDQHRKASTGGAYVRSWAESIQTSIDDNAGFPSCGTASATYKAIGDAMIAADSSLTGFTATLATDTSTGQTQAVMSWTGSTWGPCVAGRTQRVLLKMTSSGIATSRKFDETLTVVLRKPCNGALVLTGEGPCS